GSSESRANCRLLNSRHFRRVLDPENPSRCGIAVALLVVVAKPKSNESSPIDARSASENTLPPAERLKIAEILIIDDHPIVRLGLKQLIAQVPGLSVSNEASTAQEALEVVRSSVVNLAIVDLSLGDGTGLDVIRQLQQVAPWLPVLVLSIHDEAVFAERAL